MSNAPTINPLRFVEPLQAYTSVGEQLQYCIDFEHSRIAMGRRKLDKDEDETATRNGFGHKPDGERSQIREQSPEDLGWKPSLVTAMGH
jgi:hypothetical protein